MPGALALKEAGEKGGSVCTVTSSFAHSVYFSDQDHLDKEIEKLRKQLKVKVNRLFEAQGIGLQETGN